METKKIIERLELEINKTKSGELRNLLCDVNICIQTLNKASLKGDFPLYKYHPCFEKGHSFFLVCEIDTGRSKWGTHKCSRCGHEEHFQFDYA